MFDNPAGNGFSLQALGGALGNTQQSMPAYSMPRPSMPALPSGVPQHVTGYGPQSFGAPQPVGLGANSIPGFAALPPSPSGMGGASPVDPVQMAIDRMQGVGVSPEQIERLRSVFARWSEKHRQGQVAAPSFNHPGNAPGGLPGLSGALPGNAGALRPALPNIPSMGQPWRF